MSKRSPYLEQIDVPIVLIQGDRDRISDRDRMLNQVETRTISAELRGRTAVSSEFPKKAREHILAEYLFPRSSYIRLVKAQKIGTHLLPLFRSKSVARVSLYLLQRARRKIWTDTQKFSQCQSQNCCPVANYIGLDE